MSAPYIHTSTATTERVWTCPACGQPADLDRDEPCPHRLPVCWGCCRAGHGEAEKPLGGKGSEGQPAVRFGVESGPESARTDRGLRPLPAKAE